METELGAFTGLRWHEIDEDTRVDLLAARYADVLDAKKADPDAESREIRAAVKRNEKRAATARGLRAAGSSDAGIARTLRDLGLDG
jgi:DnaJ-domain-containing protein 1